MAQGSAKQGQDQASETTLASVLARLDVALSTRGAEATLGTRATETTVAAIQTALTFLGTEATLALIKAKTDNLDITLSALATALENITVQASALPVGAATETTLGGVKTGTDKIDILISALRDAILGAGTKDFTTLQALIDARTNTLGQKVKAASIPVVLPSDQLIAATIAGQASAANSSTSPLLAAGTFTGTFEEVKDFGGLCLSVFSDVASAVGGLKFQWSGDGVSIDREEATEVAAGTGRAFNVSTRARFFRVVYVNGAVGQTTFRLQSSYLSSAPGIITRAANDSFLDSNFTQPVRAALAGRRSATGTFLNIESKASSPLGTEEGMIVRPIPSQAPAFLAFYDSVVPAANKYMATLFNAAAGRKVVVQRIYAFNIQIAAVAAALSVQEIRRITARTVGTAVTPSPYDTADTLTAGITADHASTAVTDSTLLSKILRSFDEVQTSGGGGFALETLTAVHPLSIIYERKDGVRGLVLRNGEGLSIKNITAVAVGSMCYGILFTDEPA